MTIERSYQRSPTGLRPLKIIPNFYDYAEGSCLIEFGNTKVLCTATFEEKAPPHLKGTNKGWVTAEYSMLPRSSPDRIRRERDGAKGRTQEIQRLIGRSMRAICNLDGWGEKSILLDCDVLQADGGTRCASICGAFVALNLALKHAKENKKFTAKIDYPISDYVAALSVGIVNDKLVVDLDYSEDSTAQADINTVITSQGKIIEIQGTAETEPFSFEQFHELLQNARESAKPIYEAQKEIVGNLSW